MTIHDVRLLVVQSIFSCKMNQMIFTYRHSTTWKLPRTWPVDNVDVWISRFTPSQLKPHNAIDWRCLNAQTKLVPINFSHSAHVMAQLIDLCSYVREIWFDAFFFQFWYWIIIFHSVSVCFDFGRVMHSNLFESQFCASCSIRLSAPVIVACNAWEKC